ncbi:hypothetical protein SAMN06298216_2107 [Spirosomataceae bacterium TFI 002]|nr:hypothetical protein SAMN06298216_2107 [Spirosomataceae bacterium TFI 002]
MKTRNIGKKTIRNVIRVDFLLAFITGIVGVLFHKPLVNILGLSAQFIVVVSVFHLLYSCYSGFLFFQKVINKRQIRLLIFANLFWTIVSIVLLIIYWNSAFVLGKALLIIQVLVLGVLSYFEEKQLSVSLLCED